MLRYVLALFSICAVSLGAVQSRAQSLLWEVSGKKLAAPSYILGTIHMICPEDLVWTAGMDSAIARAGSICMELDMDDPEVLRKMMQGLQSDDDGKSLRESLSPAQYARLEQFVADSLGMDIHSVDAVDPGMAPLLFLQKLLPCPAPASYEAKIAMQAIGARKPIQGLETVDEQLALLERLSADTGVGEIMKVVDSFSSMKAQFMQLVTAYKQQNLDILARMIEASPFLGGQKDAFLLDRNRRWIPRMEQLMSGGPVFFAVGAGHLPGAAGVLELLRKSGYRVRALR